MNVRPLRVRPAWASLDSHWQKIKGLHLRQLFAEDPRRGERMTVEAAGIHLDHSKNRITDETAAPSSPQRKEDFHYAAPNTYHNRTQGQNAGRTG